MILLEKIFLVLFLVFSVVFTIAGFFVEGWMIFLGSTFIASTAIAMLGLWNTSPLKPIAFAQSTRLASVHPLQTGSFEVNLKTTATK